jgi:hypothetical protein
VLFFAARKLSSTLTHLLGVLVAHNNLPKNNRIPLTIWSGLILLIALEALLFADVHWSHRGAVESNRELWAVLDREPAPGLPQLARLVAVNMTPLAWAAYLFILDGVLEMQGGSPIRKRAHHFACCFLASITIWCVFDWINFYSIKAWTYIGIPAMDLGTALCYAIAFGTIVPGMLMTGQMLMNLGLFDFARGRSWAMPRSMLVTASLGGAAMLAWPIVHPDPITNLTLWTAFVFFLDPINYALGRPSMFRDWQRGWYGRTLAAFSGGLLCGFLWEFWNYWALAKWIYHLPFLGAAENVRYFQMPAPGLLGFIPFGIECWIMWQLMRIPLDGMVEPLPDDRTLL